jgi:hypothetical protein
MSRLVRQHWSSSKGRSTVADGCLKSCEESIDSEEKFGAALDSDHHGLTTYNRGRLRE